MLERLTCAPSLRRLGTAAGAAVVACGLLAGCGFTDATERVYTPANGANVNTADADVAVLGAVIVSTQSGAGRFVATISNKSLSTEVALNAVVGAAEDAAVTAGQFTPVQVGKGSYVNLADVGGIALTGPFAAGGFVRLSFSFDNDDRLTLHVPVVANAGDFAGLDGPAPPIESDQPEEPPE